MWLNYGELDNIRIEDTLTQRSAHISHVTPFVVPMSISDSIGKLDAEYRLKDPQLLSLQVTPTYNDLAVERIAPELIYEVN